MQDIRTIPVGSIEPDPDQPRKSFHEDDLRALGQNLLAIGQQVPAIVYECGDKFPLVDGARRWQAARLVGIPQLLAVVLPQKPDASHLRLVQMSLEAHKVGISAWERSCFLRRIKEENGWTISELAVQLHMKQPTVSKLLACQRLDTPIQQLLHSGGLDLEKAVIISQEPCHERQRAMVKLYASLPREQFRQKVKAATASMPAGVRRARFDLPDGVSVVVHGKTLTLSDAIACLLEAARQLKRTQAKTQDIGQAQKLLRTKARTSHVAIQKDESAR